MGDEKKVVIKLEMPKPKPIVKYAKPVEVEWKGVMEDGA